ncbi:MAG: PDZ domain-containing protein [Myxococcota bacterium]
MVLRMTQEATGAPALGEGELSGVAVDVASVDGAVQIRRVVPGSAAARAGLRVGDEVVTVDGESAIVASQARAMLRGAPGVEAIIEVRRRGRNRRIVVRRERYR